MMKNWRDAALCRGFDPDDWFPVGESGPALLQAAEAKSVCALCPVREACLAFALEAGCDHGIWGGLDAAERRALRRRNVLAMA